VKIEIKHRYDSSILFALEIGSLKLAVEAAVVSRANLSRANLSRANLSGATLSGANLFGATLSGADLSGANLFGATLSGADLSRANLFGATLSGADLSRAELSGATLSGADLSRATLSGADLSGADLSGADLSGANLFGAKHINSYRITPLLMLLDQPGPIRAYKLVTADSVGPFNGGVVYALGAEVEAPDANVDVSLQCAAGINLATLDWCMREWREGYRILVAEFRAADIAAIPTATDGKFRVRRCRIVGEKNLVEIGLMPSPAALAQGG